MRSSLLLIFVCLPLVACSNTRPPPDANRFTHDYRPPRDENYHGGSNAIVLKYDANHDGDVTRAELEAGLHADFDRFDTSHKNCLNPEQVAAINAERIAADQSTATPLQDFRQNGCVDFQEFAAAPQSLFDLLDKDGNGTVTVMEFTPRPGPGGARGRPGGEGGSPPQ